MLVHCPRSCRETSVLQNSLRELLDNKPGVTISAAAIEALSLISKLEQQGDDPKDKSSLISNRAQTDSRDGNGKGPALAVTQQAEHSLKVALELIDRLDELSVRMNQSDMDVLMDRLASSTVVDAACKLRKPRSEQRATKVSRAKLKPGSSLPENPAKPNVAHSSSKQRVKKRRKDVQ